MSNPVGESRTCTRCGVEMTRGHIFSATKFIPDAPPGQRALERVAHFAVHGLDGPQLIAFRCPKCCVVEFVAPDDHA